MQKPLRLWQIWLLTALVALAWLTYDARDTVQMVPAVRATYNA